MVEVGGRNIVNALNTLIGLRIACITELLALIPANGLKIALICDKITLQMLLLRLHISPQLPNVDRVTLFQLYYSLTICYGVTLK